MMEVSEVIQLALFKINELYSTFILHMHTKHIFLLNTMYFAQKEQFFYIGVTYKTMIITKV